MTEDQLEDLYKEVKQVLYNKTMDMTNMTPSQRVFKSAFDDYSLGIEIITTYSNLVHLTPGINLRDLHAFCIGIALAQKFESDDYKVTQTTH
jgi:hypothetical protein